MFYLTVTTNLYTWYPFFEQVMWDDIGGEDDIKKSLKEAVDWPLNHPEVCECVYVCVHFVFAIS